MTRVNKTVLVLVALVALVLGLTVHKVLTAQRQADPTVLLDAGIVILPQTRKVPALEFTNQDGQAVSTASLKGRWHLLFFGYTFAPMSARPPSPSSANCRASCRRRCATTCR